MNKNFIPIILKYLDDNTLEKFKLISKKFIGIYNLEYGKRKNTHLYKPSIWDDVEISFENTLYDIDIIDKLWNNIPNIKNKFKLLHTNRRILPQLDYNYKKMYVTDIIYRYKNNNYLLYANIVCKPYIMGKWHLHIDNLYPFLIKLDKNIIETTHLNTCNFVTDSYLYYVNEPYNFCNLDDHFGGCDCDEGIIGTEFGYISNVIFNYHGDKGYTELRYYDDPKRELFKEQINLKKKIDNWKILYDNNRQIPTDEFDLIIFLMLIYKKDYIDSGK